MQRSNESIVNLLLQPATGGQKLLIYLTFNSFGDRLFLNYPFNALWESQLQGKKVRWEVFK